MGVDAFFEAPGAEWRAGHRCPRQRGRQERGRTAARRGECGGSGGRSGRHARVGPRAAQAVEHGAEDEGRRAVHRHQAGQAVGAMAEVVLGWQPWRERQLQVSFSINVNFEEM